MPGVVERWKGFLEKNGADFFRPCPAHGLAVFRIVFGALMVCDLFHTRGFATVDDDWGSWACNFPLIESLPTPSPAWITILYLVSALGAVGIIVGFHFKHSCLVFAVPYSYIHLLDKGQWNNHFYLYAILGTMMACTDANAVWSLDSIGNPPMQVERWQYLILQWQTVLVYLIAGLKKVCDPDWVHGYSARRMDLPDAFHVLARYGLNLPEESIKEAVNLVVVHWGGMIFDTIVGPMFMMRSTRNIALFLSSIFHGTNLFTFRIGVFPLVMASMSSLFYDASWPLALLPGKKPARESTASSHHASRRENAFSLRKLKICSYVALFFASQVFLPYSHWITQGYNGWTQGLYGYSWDMMVHNWYTGQVKLKLVDTMKNETYAVNPRGLTRSTRWSQHPDMMLQMGQCLTNLYCSHRYKPGKESENCRAQVEIYPTDVWKSLNYRPVQRMFQPDVDLNHAGRKLWHPLQKAGHLVLPPVSDDYRFAYQPPGSSFEDLIFADFHGMESEFALAQSVVSAELQLLEGTISVEAIPQSGRTSKTVLKTTGQTMKLKPGYHVSVAIESRPFAVFRIALQKKSTSDKQSAVIEDETPLSGFLRRYLRGMDLLARAIDDLVFDVPFEPEDEKLEEERFSFHFAKLD